MGEEVMEIRPITYRKACEHIDAYHRHHRHPRGQKFALAAYNEEKLLGVATAGRPVARGLDDGLTLEITRVCTDGYRNACSFLYGAVCRVAKEMGYKTVVTYTLESEDGASVKSANFEFVKTVPGRSWSCPTRERKDHLIANKTLWKKVLRKRSDG